MCDAYKYFKIYDEIKKLQPEDTLRLMLEARTKEERDFFEIVGNFLLQRKQQQIMEKDMV